MRLLIVDHTGGILPYQGKFKALAARPGIELTVFCPNRWVEYGRSFRTHSEERPGYSMRVGAVCWPGYENRCFFLSGLAGVVRRTHPDLIHLFEEPFSFIAFQSLLARFLYAPRAPVLFFSSDDLSYGFRYPYRPSWVYAQIERFSHRHCAGATIVNREVGDVLRSKGFDKPLQLTPHGLDLGPYETQDRHPAISELRQGGDRLIVGYVGRLLHMKGVDLLLRAFASLRDRSEKAPWLVILGHGPEETTLRGLAGELGIAGRVRFLPAVANEQVPAVLRSIDVLVLPSRRVEGWQEQFGRILTEGMAAGCTVIGSTCGAIPDVIGDAGLLFPQNDIPALTDALARTVQDRPLRAEMSRRGMERVRGRYTWDAVAETLVAFYGRILSIQATGEGRA